MVHDSVVSCIGGTPVVRLSRLFPMERLSVLAKLELCNPGGSVKDRPARYIVEAGLRDGTITSDTHLIESSSGNLGIALAMVARVYGLRFTCVVDPKIASANLAILRRLGATVDMVQEHDDQGGYLKTRIRRVHELVKRIPGSLWVNQYANRKNWQAHFHGTAGEIVTDVGEHLDALVVGVSTSGTDHGIVTPPSPGVSQIARDRCRCCRLSHLWSSGRGRGTFRGSGRAAPQNGCRLKRLMTSSMSAIWNPSKAVESWLSRCPCPRLPY